MFPSSVVSTQTGNRSPPATTPHLSSLCVVDQPPRSPVNRPRPGRSSPSSSSADSPPQVQGEVAAPTERRSLYPCVSLEALKLWLSEGRPHKAVWVSSLPCAERLLSRGLALQAELAKVLCEIEQEAAEGKKSEEKEDKAEESPKAVRLEENQGSGDSVIRQKVVESQIGREEGGASFEERISPFRERLEQQQRGPVSVARTVGEGDDLHGTREHGDRGLSESTPDVCAVTENSLRKACPATPLADPSVAEATRVHAPRSERVVDQPLQDCAEHAPAGGADERDQEKEEEERGHVGGAETSRLEEATNLEPQTSKGGSNTDSLEAPSDRKTCDSKRESEGRQGGIPSPCLSRQQEHRNDNMKMLDQEEKKIWKRLYDVILSRCNQRAVSPAASSSSSAGVDKSLRRERDVGGPATLVRTKSSYVSIYAGPHGEQGTCLLQTQNIEWLKLEQRLFQVGVCGLEGEDFFHHLVACSAWFREASLLVECIRSHGRRTYSLDAESVDDNSRAPRESELQSLCGNRDGCSAGLQSGSSPFRHSREPPATSPQSAVQQSTAVGDHVEEPTQGSASLPPMGEKDVSGRGQHEEDMSCSLSDADGLKKQEGEGEEEKRSEPSLTGGREGSPSSSVPSPQVQQAAVSVPWLQRSVYHIWRMIQVYTPLRRKCLEQYHRYFGARLGKVARRAALRAPSSVVPAVAERTEEAQRSPDCSEEAQPGSSSAGMQRPEPSRGGSERGATADCSSSCDVSASPSSARSSASSASSSARDVDGRTGGAPGAESTESSATALRIDGTDQAPPPYTEREEDKKVPAVGQLGYGLPCEHGGVYGSVRVFVEEGALLADIIKCTLCRILAFEKKLRDLPVLGPLPCIVLPGGGGGEDFVVGHKSAAVDFSRQQGSSSLRAGCVPAGLRTSTEGSLAEDSAVLLRGGKVECTYSSDERNVVQGTKLETPSRGSSSESPSLSSLSGERTGHAENQTGREEKENNTRQEDVAHGGTTATEDRGEIRSAPTPRVEESISSRREDTGSDRGIDETARRRAAAGETTRNEKLSITQWKDLLGEATGLGLRVERVDWLLQVDAGLKRCQKQLELVAANELKLPSVQSLHALVSAPFFPRSTRFLGELGFGSPRKGCPAQCPGTMPLSPRRQSANRLCRSNAHGAHAYVFIHICVLREFAKRAPRCWSSLLALLL